jgi:CheY-like chemotaxis protein
MAKIAKAARQAGAKRLFILFSPTERRALRSETLYRFDGWLVKSVRSASLLARLLPESGQAGRAHHLVRDAAPKLEGVDILLTEDNEISRRVALKHLGRHGARLATAEGFGAIILDIRMPVLDGLAAARHIRAAETAGHRTPLIALTANAFASDKTCGDRGRHRLFHCKTCRSLRLSSSDRNRAGADLHAAETAARCITRQPRHNPFGSNR